MNGRVLVTGAAGFLGRHVARALAARGVEVVALHHSTAPPAGVGATWIEVDLRDAAAVALAVTFADATHAIHLAARSARPDAGHDELAAMREVNVLGTRNLLDALVAHGRPVRVVACGSSAQYGAVPLDGQPIGEETPFRAVGPYGWSKVAAEALALSYNDRRRIEVVVARVFNACGPGEPERLVCSAFARQVAVAEAGAATGEDVVRVGNLETVRDLCDARDLARGLVAALERGAPGRAYNLCSGRGTPVRDVLARLLAASHRPLGVREEAGRRAPGDVDRQVGSGERARAELGWTPQIPLAQSLQELLDEWRERIGALAEGPA